MKSENTLRAARNSLLCFFMALVAGFLVACGGNSDSPDEFPVYLSDSAAEGVEYSGPAGSGLTGKGGVFMASEGMFEFSIGRDTASGGTTLGRVQLNRDWENSHVTPADFIDVDAEAVISIARIVQGLDEDGDPQNNGISIPQRARTDVNGDLFDVLAENQPEDLIIDVLTSGTPSPVTLYAIPPKSEAEEHFLATRRCLFSGGYEGDYRATSGSRIDDKGQIYYVVEPVANRARGVRFSNVYPNENNGRLIDGQGSITVGAIGSVITLSPGNELSFVTPSLVTGIWNDEGESGTSALALVEGNPRATRRVVGVETLQNADQVRGMYVLDHFDDEGPPSGIFLGRYRNVADNAKFALSLNIADGGFWPAPTATGMTTLTLVGMRTADNGDEFPTAVTVRIVRTKDNTNMPHSYGSFEGDGIDLFAGISGTWCDISGAVGTAVPPPLPPSPPKPAVSLAGGGYTQIKIAWLRVPGARSYRLYRRSDRINDDKYKLVGDGALPIDTRSHQDVGLEEGTKYFYQLEACNSSGCSARSPTDSATTNISTQ